MQDKPFTIILDDPLSNSFIGPPPSIACLPAHSSSDTENGEQLKDDGLNVEEYKRSKEQDDNLGISDLKTEGYQDAADSSDEVVNYGTDKVAELSDRQEGRHARGPDHPNIFGKPEDAKDETGFGEDSTVWRIGDERSNNNC